jgi:hypothetical protein
VHVNLQETDVAVTDPTPVASVTDPTSRRVLM